MATFLRQLDDAHPKASSNSEVSPGGPVLFRVYIKPAAVCDFKWSWRAWL